MIRVSAAGHLSARYSFRSDGVGALLRTAPRNPVETMGFEPTTPCLQSRCSSQLSYVPVAALRISGRGGPTLSRL